uniref:Ig-like domain-containing protein n=1 Tax=Oncorhynchus mykiss TaxID=8022 RepID=A0A8K9USY8_ONCMY
RNQVLSRNLSILAFQLRFIQTETITPVKPEVNALQGTDITLSCNYKGKVNNLQWYRQYPGSRPECLLWILQTSKYVQNTSITTPRHTGRLNEEKTRVDLMISSVELEDSALYHCALQPTVTGNPDTLYKNLSSPLGVSSALTFVVLFRFLLAKVPKLFHSVTPFQHCGTSCHVYSCDF